MYRREQRHGDVAAQAGVQGGHLDRRRDRACPEGHEQDDGQHDAGERETYVCLLCQLLVLCALTSAISGVRDAYPRREQEAQSEDLQARRDRRAAAETRAGEEGRGRGDGGMISPSLSRVLL